MKKVYAVFLSFCFILLFTSQAAANKDGTILLSARLSGGQEVPKIVTSAKGLVTIILEEDKSLTINGVFDGLSGAVTNCHFHNGAFGAAGSVVLDLKSYVKGNRIYGKIPTPSKAFIAQLTSDNIYINVHTAANTGGEIRGQVYTENEYHLWTIMSGAFEVPMVNTQALGLASVVLSASLTKLEYKVVVNGLSGPVTGAHLHYGSAGVSGPVAFPLTVTGNVLTGSFEVDTAFIAKIDSGKVYVNIHTAANPGGEIRGQLGFINGVYGYDALMDGASEVPTVTTTAKGLAVAWSNPSLDTLQYAVLYTGLTPTAAHFHGGPKTGTGSVIVALTPYTIQGIANTNAYVARIPWSNENLTKLLKDSIYVNIHTTANGGGEIRGHLATSLLEGTVADLCGKQEVPAVTSAGSGAGYVSFDRTKGIGYVDYATTGLSGPATAAHIHIGPKGVVGGVFFNLSNGNAFGFPRTTLADTLLNGLMYLNVHTAANPNGEVRGQLGKTLTPDCLPTGLFELNGEKLSATIFPNPTSDALSLVFESNQSFDAQVVISDLIGRSVSVKNFKVQDGENQLPLSVSNLANGLYFIQLKNNGKVIFSEKIVKE